MSPALAGGLSTTGPPGKPPFFIQPEHEFYVDTIPESLIHSACSMVAASINQ